MREMPDNLYRSAGRNGPDAAAEDGSIVDRPARDKASRLILDLLSRKIGEDEFDRDWPDGTGDGAIREVEYWLTDCRTSEDVNSIPDDFTFEGRQAWQKAALFLRTDLPYPWPKTRSKNLIAPLGCLICPVLAVLGLLGRWIAGLIWRDLPVTHLVYVLPGATWIFFLLVTVRQFRRQDKDLASAFERVGGWKDCWPFANEADLEAARGALVNHELQGLDELARIRSSMRKTASGLLDAYLRGELGRRELLKQWPRKGDLALRERVLEEIRRNYLATLPAGRFPQISSDGRRDEILQSWGESGLSSIPTVPILVRIGPASHCGFRWSAVLQSSLDLR